MNEPKSIDDALRPVRAAAGSLIGAVERADERLSLRNATPAAIPAALRDITLMRERAVELVARIDDASARLSEIEQEQYDPRRFDPGRWPERQQAISRELQARPLDGAVSWLTVWARAFLTGCSDEADRLVAEPFALPPEAAWCPDRLSTAADARQARSVERLAPLLRYLVDGAPLAGRESVTADVRSRAAVLHGRLVLHAGRDGAEELFERAQHLAGADDAEVLAARAALARARAATAGADGAQADEAAALARRAWDAERCAAAAVERFYADQPGTGTMPDALVTARDLVDELPFATALLDGMFDVLIQPVPDAIWAAAAERAVRGGDPDSARRLADRVSSDADPLLLAELADLRVRIAEGSGEQDQAVADLLDAAGVAAMVAGQPQRAITTFGKALDLVRDHRDASLHLADALLSGGWGKPLHEVEPQLRKALELLTQEWNRRPIDSETSWSLLTESLLHTQLASAVTPEVRAAELWQACLAAARAIAFEPSDGRRWSRLADTLTSLKCRRAALVLSDYAFRLAPDEPTVRDARLVALSNLGQLEEAFATLAGAKHDTSGPWYSAVRAFLLRMSADHHPGEAADRLKDALTAADEAVRNQPDGLWFHQVRAEALLDLGAKDQAEEEFEYIWQESRLDEADDLASAAQAAVELRLGPDAVSLSEQVVGLADATVADADAYTSRGIARILEGDSAGLSDLEAASALASTRAAIKDLRARVSRLAGIPGAEGSAVDLGAVTAAISARAAQIEADDKQSPQVFIGAELGSAAANRHYDPDVSRLAALVASLAGAFGNIAAGEWWGQAALRELAGQHPEYPELSSAAAALVPSHEPGTEEPAAAPAAPAATQPSDVEVFLPPSWFSGLADPMDHEVIKRFVPDARARLRRKLGETLPGVNFRDYASLEPGGFLIKLRGAVIDEGRVSLERFYCPAELRAALPAQIQAELEPASDVADLDCFTRPPHPDSLTALVAWSAPEVVVRQLERAFTIDQAVAKGDLTAAETQYRSMVSAREQRLGGDNPATVTVRYNLAVLLEMEGRLSEAEAGYRTVLDVQTRTVGADDVSTSLTRQQLANLLVAQGRFADAEAEQRALLAACERLFGGDDPVTVTARYELAGILRRQDRLAEAEAEYRAVLDAYARTKGADDPDTLVTRRELAIVLAEQGRLADAEAQYRAVLAARERLAGGDDPATLTARYELAGILRRQDRLAEAEAEYRAVLDAYTRTKGADDPDTLITRRQLAAVLQQGGRFGEAEAEHRVVVAARERLLGADDPATLIARYDLAWVVHRQGRLAEAEAEYRAVLDAETRTRGADDPDTLITRRELAAVLADQDRLAEAEKEYRAVLAARERLAGADDPATLVIRYELAGVLRRQGRPAEAEAEYRAVLDGYTRIRGADDPDTLITRRQLAAVLADQGRLADAEAEVRAVLAARERPADADEPATLMVRYELAGLLHREGRLAEAEAEYRAVLDAETRTQGPDDANTLITRRELAIVLAAQGRLAEAEAEVRAVLAARERLAGADDPATLMVRYELAGLLHREGRLADAEAEYRAVLAARERLAGADDPATLGARYELAGVLRGQGRLADAEAEYRAVLDVESRIRGLDDPETVTIRRQLAGLLVQDGRLADAEAEYRAVLAAREPLAGGADPAALITRYDLAGVLRRQGRLTEAEAEYRAVLDAETRTKGADDADTLITRRELAIVLAEQGRLADAEAEHRAVLAARERVLGGNDPATLITRSELGAVLAEQGRLADAETEYRTVLAAQTRIRGSDDPDTLAIRRQLAGLLVQDGRLADAESEYRAVLAAREPLAGGADPAALITRYDLAGVLRRQGRLAEAEAEYRAVLDAETRTKGADVPDTLITRRELATVLAEQGRLADAEAEFRAVLAARERLRGSDDTATLITRYELAWVLYRQGRLAEAAAECRAVLDAYTRIRGADDPDTLAIGRQLATVLADQARLADDEQDQDAVQAGRDQPPDAGQ